MVIASGDAAVCTMVAVHEPVFLITGASGYLGRRLVARATIRGRVHAATHRPAVAAERSAVTMEIGDRDAVLEIVERLKPTAVIHAAAVNPGQGDETEMMRVNADGSRFVAEAARAVDARLVAVSTDNVHDGRAGPYADDAPPTPINAYGRSKAAGEKAVFEVDASAVVVRTSLMYGLDEMDRGTAGFAERLARGEELSLFSDVLRNPVHVDVLADALVQLTEVDYSGLLNVAGRQALTREEFGRTMLAYWGVEDDGLIQPVCAADISDTIPLDVRLVSNRGEMLLETIFPGVDDVLSTTPPTSHSD
ncbi:MAG: SDR family oxidoreductase [Actinomycetota bacterium]|nr:SDR family oxidoreductase [Actinomycetota bacterium]